MSDLTLQIRRDLQISGGLRPFLIFADGDPVGVLKNGRTLSVQLPPRDAYVLDTQFSFSGLAVLSAPETDLAALRARVNANGELQFLTPEGGALPKCSVSPYVEAPDERPEARALRLVYEWYVSLQDGADEALMELQLPEMLAALEEVGAHGYVRCVRELLDALFPGCALPLPDDDETAERAAQAIPMLRKRQMPPVQNSLDTELRRAVAAYVKRHRLYG